MKTYKYRNYKDYIDSQVAANVRKKKNVWAKEENVKFLADYIRLRRPEKGLCHGVRQGFEQLWFAKYLQGCRMMGTEIGDIKGKNTIKWDFNVQKSDWIGYFDFIYSNSFDHAFNPKNTLQTWIDQLKKGGVLILEYDRRQEHTGEISKSVNKTDPVSIRFDELQKLIPKWIYNAKVIDILNMPVVTFEWRKAMIIEVDNGIY